MKKTLISNFQFPILNFKLEIIALLTAVFISFMAAAPLCAQDKGKEQIIAAPKDFIEKNLKEFNERLKRLKELYQNQYGSLFAATSPVDAELIAKELPKPMTLRLAVQYPEEKKQEERKITIESGDYFLDDIYVYAEVDRMYQLTHGYSYSGENILVAADVQSSQLLGLPYKARLNTSGRIYYISKDRTSTYGGYGEVCCISVGKEEYCAEASNTYPYRCIRKAYNEYCSKYAEIPKTGYLWEDPRLYRKELSLSVQKIQGATVNEKMNEVTFSSPGKKDITFISPRKYSPEEQYRTYRSCIPKFSYRYSGSYYGYSSASYGLDKAVTGYKTAGNISSGIKFTAVKFKKFGFPGHQIDASYGGKLQDLDYFYDSNSSTGRYAYDYGGSTGRLEPHILLDYGDAGGLKAVKASEIKAPVTWSITKTGPFSISEDGYVTYRGGSGETNFRVTLGGYESVEGSITANSIELVLDDTMKRRAVSPGKNHKVIIKVKGSADMNRYQVKWTGEGGKWAQNVTPFKKVGDAWQAEGSFGVAFDGLFDKSSLNKPVKIAAELIRTADNSKIYAYENSDLKTTYPAVDKLELYAGVGKATPEKVTEPIDLFTSFETPKVVLLPRLSIKGGDPYSLGEINPSANIQVTSSNPAIIYVENEVARLSSGRELNYVNIIALPAGRTGSAKVVAKMGGKDLDPAGYANIAGDQNELISNAVEINVNDVYLLAETSTGGRATYKLMINGPADMSKYQARWTGEATRTTSFTKDNGVFTTTLDTTLRMDRVTIEKAGKAFAQFNVKTAARRLSIKLLPPKPPVTVVSKVDVANLGSLETITECKKQVGRQIELFGFNPGMAVEDYCRAEREKQKQEIKGQREDQKAFNKMLSDLNNKGQDLVVVSDTMRVGAAVKGDITAMGSDVFCFWSLENKANIELQSAVTPIEKVGSDEGACFNIVRGLKGGFNPDTVLKVDLVVPPKPVAPVVADREKVITYGGTLIR